MKTQLQPGMLIELPDGSKRRFLGLWEPGDTAEPQALYESIVPRRKNRERDFNGYPPRAVDNEYAHHCNLSGFVEWARKGRVVAGVRHRGRNTHRLAQNPMEQRFADQWEKINEHPGQCLNYLLGDGNRPGQATPDQEELAATVIQWLGSPVGRAFLRDVGFVPKETP